MHRTLRQNAGALPADVACYNFLYILKAGLAGRPPAAAARGRQRPTLPPDRSLEEKMLPKDFWLYQWLDSYLVRSLQQAMRLLRELGTMSRASS
jgi:hypothetical protein